MKKKETFDAKTINIPNDSLDDFQTNLDDLKAKSEEKTPKGRLTKDAKQAQQALETITISGDMFKPILNVINRVLVTIYGESVKLSIEEMESINHYSAIVMAKYMPNLVTKFGAEFALVSLISSIGVEKYYNYHKVNKGKKVAEKSNIDDSGQKGVREDLSDSEKTD